MKKIIGVQIFNHKQIDYLRTNQDDLEINDDVLIKMQGCKFLAKVIKVDLNIAKEDLPSTDDVVVRFAKKSDYEKDKINQKDALEAFEIAKEKIFEHQLEMKLVNSEYSLDRQKLIFNFTSDIRVDFRLLVRDLASIFHTRIELRQIGYRDSARYIGAIGPCGRPLCCNSFLGDFMPVSIKMAKNQDLSLNPVKISGVCGRLMCCLKYEDDHYKEVKKELPDINEYVVTPDGCGIVTNLNLLKCTVFVKLDGFETSVEYDSSEVKKYDGGVIYE